jgi:hypothetical protein
VKEQYWTVLGVVKEQYWTVLGVVKEQYWTVLGVVKEQTESKDLTKKQTDIYSLTEK